jgi:osmotically-inducible protein OsmY
MAEYWDRERGRRYRGGEGYYGGYYGHPEREYGRHADDRGFFERAGDEVRSWFGDEEAHRRRQRDERESPSDERRWASRERGDDDRRWGGWRRGDDTEREWARQWGYVEGRGSRGDADRDARGWGYSGGYGAGAGFVGDRPDWSGYESGGWTGRERYGSRPFTGGGMERSTYGEGRYEDIGGRLRRSAGGGPHAGKGPRGYQRSDERIREDVCERMAECGELDAGEIEVRVSNAEVTLLGTVRERYDKRLAEDLADQVSGVREVHNQIRVAQPAQDAQPPRQGDQQRYRIA